MQHTLTLRTVQGNYAIARLAAGAGIPAWVNGAGFSSIIRADDELTLICDQSRIPDGVEADRDWICLRTVGPFAFDAAGVVHALITPLSTNGIGIFVVCTFDGEHLLIAGTDESKARKLLQDAGHIWM